MQSKEKKRIKTKQTNETIQIHWDSFRSVIYASLEYPGEKEEKCLSHNGQEIDEINDRL